MEEPTSYPMSRLYHLRMENENPKAFLSLSGGSRSSGVLARWNCAVGFSVASISGLVPAAIYIYIM